MVPPSFIEWGSFPLFSVSFWIQTIATGTTVEKIQSMPEEMISCIGAGPATISCDGREHLDVHSDWEGIDWVLRIHIKRHLKELITENIIGLVKIPIDKLKTLRSTHSVLTRKFTTRKGSD